MSAVLLGIFAELEEEKMIVRAIVEKIVSRLRYKDNGFWVFGEWFGNRCCDNCMYFANYVSRNYNDINCVWVTRKSTDVSGLDSRIQIMEMNTPEANRVVRNAHMIFMNQGMRDLSDDIVSVSGPKTVNFWHGVPWKKIGLDGAKGISWARRKYYAFQNKILAADYFLALSADFSKILCSSCGANPRRIIKSGYPRNTILYSDTKMLQCRKKLADYLEHKSTKTIDFSNCRIITYMPTFRDTEGDQFSFVSILENESFTRILEEENAIVIQKAHFVSKGEKSEEAMCRVFSEKEYPAQELLAATDILITDYSSCFFDFLICDRPIIHFLYDFDYYANHDRGLYYDQDTVVCGAVANTAEELIDSIEKYIKNPLLDSDIRKKRRKEFIEYESADSCEDIFRRIN